MRIEELIVYYSRFTTETDVRSYEIGKAPPSILSAFFIPRFEKDIMNFSVNWRPPTTVFTLDIPGKNPEYAKHGYKQSKTPEQFFLEQLLSELLTAIVTEINKYAYHTEITSNVFKTDVRKNFASRFSNWVNSFSSTDIVRMYSLNYDRNFKIYLEANNTSIFEGFNCHDVQCGAILKPGDIGVPDIKRILTDFDCISYYNIHGSAFWDVIPRDKSHFFNPKFVLHGYPRFPSSNYELANTQIETGKTMFVSNIITGYQKSQRTVITPFRQMQAAFDKDCLFADTIYIIGYSFGDEHINVSIKNALECNPNTQIIIVDKGFIQNQMDFRIKRN